MLTSRTGVRALAREAVAALLNAASSAIDYPLTVDEVIDLVQAALAPGGDIEAARAYLVELNDLDCPYEHHSRCGGH